MLMISAGICGILIVALARLYGEGSDPETTKTNPYVLVVAILTMVAFANLIWPGCPT